MKAGRELHAHRSGSDNRHRLGNLAEIENFDVGEDALRVRLQPRKHARFRARSEHDVARLEHLRAAAVGDFDLPGSGQTGASLDPVDFVLFHQELDALGVFGDDLVFPIAHAGFRNGFRPPPR